MDRTKKDILADIKKAGIVITSTIEAMPKPKLEDMLESVKVEDNTDERIEQEKPSEDNTDEDERITQKEDSSNPTDDEKGDYLQQYQYKKEIPLGHITTNPSPGSKAERQKKFFLGQEQASIFIPRDESESPSIPKSVTINGYRLDFPKQTYIKVPLGVAEVIMDSENQTVAALRPFRIDRDEATENALG